MRSKDESNITKKQNKNKKTARITTYLPIITMNVNGLNYSTKRHRLAD
jgi:hypothetical protein